MLHTVPGTDQNIVDMTLALESSHSGERDTRFKPTSAYTRVVCYGFVLFCIISQERDGCPMSS